MQNENTIFEGDNADGMNVNPPLPSITPKSGWTTSQGQMTAIFTIICLGLSLLGFHYTPEQFDNWVSSGEHLAETMLPLITAVFGIIQYTKSRAAVYSSAMAATAHVQAAALTPPPVSSQAGTLLAEPVGFAGLGGLSHIIGGKNWKDPRRYENLLHVAAQFGVPGATQADAVNQKLHPVDLISGILDAIDKRKGQ